MRAIKVEYYASIRGSCCRESPTNNAHTRYVCGHLLVLAVKLRELDATRGRKRDHVSVAQGVEHLNPRDKTAPRGAKI